MRKADYAALAEIIRAKRERAIAGLRVTPDSIIGRQVVATCEAIAREFAQRASVDRAAFLLACGLQD